MALSDAEIRGLKPKKRPYKRPDGRGLWVYVTPKGRRLWHFRFRQPSGKGKGKDTTMSFGSYPEVPLTEARDKALAARRLLIDGKHPTVEKKADRAQLANTFEPIAYEWLGKQAFAEVTRAKAEWVLGLVLPDIGSRPIAEIEAPEVLKTLRKIEAKGLHETAVRAKQRIGQVFRYAAADGRAKHDPTSLLRGALQAPEVTNRAALIDPRQVGELLRAIDGYIGQPTTHAALKLAPLTFVRPGELRAAEWSEFQLDGKEPTWRIPKERMKMDRPHLVPLSKQAIAVLRELQPLTGRTRYLFPSLRAADRPMSNNTVNAALRRLGYASDEQTGHGFRSTASTLLNEQGWNADWIEVQLAHRERDKVRDAYNHAKYLPDRRRMMQSWADYLDELRTAAAAKAAA